jgi:3-mercaptopyruvate sulfurtransferase SseA
MGGARAGLATLVLRILGYDHASNYAASFNEWSKQPDTEVMS